MKFKIIVLSAGVFFTSLSIHAQDMQIRTGLNLANISITDNGRVDQANSVTSFHAGIVSDIPVAKIFSVQAGVLFTGKGSKVQSGDPSNSDWSKSVFNPYYLELPVTATFKLPVSKTLKLFAGAGPYIAMGIAGKRKMEGANFGLRYEDERSITYSNDDPTTFEEEEGAGFGVIRRFDYGLNGIAGVEGKSLVVGLNYGYGLAKLQSGSNSNIDNNDKHRVFSLTLGFKL